MSVCELFKCVLFPFLLFLLYSTREIEMYPLFTLNYNDNLNKSNNNGILLSRISNLNYFVQKLYYICIFMVVLMNSI